MLRPPPAPDRPAGLRSCVLALVALGLSGCGDGTPSVADGGDLGIRFFGPDVLVEGSIWVERYPEAAEPTAHWVVLCPDGEVAARLELPRRFEPLEIGSDYVVGVLTDEMDVEHVVVAELDRRPG